MRGTEPGGVITAFDRFFGRHAEVATMVGAAREVAGGEQRTILIEGETGIGKTALVRQWLRHPDMSDFVKLWASGHISERDYPFGLIDQILSGVAENPHHTLSPDAAPLEVGSQLVNVLHRAQAGGPVAVVIDDVQWADRSSVLALGFAIRRLWRERILIVLVATSNLDGDPDTEWRRLVGTKDGAPALSLAGLPVAAVAEALAARPAAQVAELAPRIWRHTGGHPLYLQAVLATLPDAVVPAELGVPPSLVDSIRRQTAALPKQSRELLETLAVIGERCPLGRVAQAARTVDQFAAVEPLIGAGLVRWWPDDPSCPVEIRHPLQRDAVYRAITPSRRAELHRAVQPVVDRDKVWAHRVAAAQGTDEALAGELTDEADRLVDQGYAARAAMHLLWAADLSAERAPREERLLRAVLLYVWIDEFARARRLLDRVSACAPSALRSLVLGGYALSRADMAVAHEQLTAALEDLRDRPESADLAGMAGALLSRYYMFQGDGRGAVAATEAALAAGPMPPDIAALLHGTATIGRCYTDGPVAAWRATMATLDLPEAWADAAPTDAALYFHRGLVAMLAGRVADSERDLVAAQRLGRIVATAHRDEFVHMQLAMAYYYAGDWDDASVQAAGGLEITFASDRQYALAHGYTAAILVPAGRGDLDTVRDYLRALDEASKALGLDQFQSFAALSTAVAAQARRDYPAMRAAIQRLLAVPNCAGFRTAYQFIWRPLEVEALLGNGELDAAATALAALRSFAGPVPCLDACVAWLSGWLRLAGGDAGAALAGYRHYHDVATPDRELPLHRALFEQSYGTALASIGRVDEAGQRLRDARSRLTRLGATAFVAHCDADLAAVGARVARPAVGPQLTALTERERQVAHLIGKGMTNVEIAQELFLSAKTVEYHLSHVFTKLGVANRRQLRTLMQAALVRDAGR